MRPLSPRPRYGDGIGLHRVQAVLDEIPGVDRLATIKVTGSNGKGSTCVMLASILRRAGLSVGLYTSPHLLRWNERIVVDGEEIDDDALAESFAWSDAVQSSSSELFGAFELATLMAARHFVSRGVDVVVAEAGIGGRYDATRALSRPPGLASTSGQSTSRPLVGLTSIDLEHTELLGETPELIAYDKADLCPAGGILVVGRLEEDLLRRLDAYTRLRGVEMQTALDAPDARLVEQLPLSLAGQHQITNAQVAAALARIFLEKRGMEAPQVVQAIQEGLTTTTLRDRLRGRLEAVHRDPDVLVDVGHTPAAATVTAEAVQALYPGREILLVIGVSENKEVESIARALAPIASQVICTRPLEGGCEVERIQRALATARPDLKIETVEKVEKAVQKALGEARGRLVLIAGGLFLVAEALRSDFLFEDSC